jgi:hypothetical protein
MLIDRPLLIRYYLCSGECVIYIRSVPCFLPGLQTDSTPWCRRPSAFPWFLFLFLVAKLVATKLIRAHRVLPPPSVPYAISPSLCARGAAIRAGGESNYSRSRRFQTLHSQVAVNHRGLSRGSAFILVSQRRGDGPVMRASLGQFCHRATQSGRRAFVLCFSNRRREIADPTSKSTPSPGSGRRSSRK